MAISYRLIAKIGLLLVVFGFFMPISYDLNGFEIARYMINNNHVIESLLLYLVFISAVIGVIVWILLLINKNVPTSVDWLVIIICIASGLIVYVSELKNWAKLQFGAYVIIAGWIISLVAQIISKARTKL